MPGNFFISPDLTSIPDRLSFIWTATRDIVLRKRRLSSTYRYDLQFQVKNNNLHLVYILLFGDVATNPGPRKDQLALRDDIVYNRLISGKNCPNWSDHLEIISFELDLLNSEKSLVCVCYRPPSYGLNEWLEVFSAFLQETSYYENVFITGDFNFPDLTWNSSLVPNKQERSISDGSSEFRELTFDVFSIKSTCTQPGTTTFLTLS